MKISPAPRTAPNGWERVQTALAYPLKTGYFMSILCRTKEGKIRFGRTLVSFIGLTVMLLSAELWLIGGLAAQGSRIVFSNLVFDNFEIYVMDADGGSRENLSNHPVDDMDPDWSPDGTKIAFVSDRNDGEYQIHVMDSDGKNQIRLTDGPRRKRYPDWSPDGQQIAFSVHDGISHIEVMDADGHNRVVLENDASEPSWSPDGGKIAFQSWRDGEIFVIGADGQGLERVTHDFLGGLSPSFSPEGRRIAYWSAEAGFHHIYVMGADGKNRKRLTHNQEHHSHPTWSPDGQTIAYVVSDDDIPFGAKIHLMTADGKYIKQLSKVRGEIDDQPDFSPVGLAVSPSSNKITTWGRLKKFAPNRR